MTINRRILNYAFEKRGPFRRKDLLLNLIGQNNHINEKSVDIQLTRLLIAGKLQKIGHGKYMLNRDCRQEFIYHPSPFEKNLYSELKRLFPMLEFCIWSPKVLSAMMIHIPDIGFTFIDVENDGMEPVFNALQSMDSGKNILITPTEIECDRYLAGTDSIVVRKLISRSPITEIDGCKVPRIEKILTDSVGDIEMKFAGGSEIFNIFENAYERYDINSSKMLAYASRRNRKEKIEQILKTINHDSPSP